MDFEVIHSGAQCIKGETGPLIPQFTRNHTEGLAQW